MRSITLVSVNKPDPDGKSDNLFLVAGVIFVAHAIKHIYNSGRYRMINPEIRKGLGLSYSQLGSLDTSSHVSAWISNMFAGYLGERFSRDTGLMLGISLALMAGSIGLAGFVNNYGFMLAVMFLIGIGPAMFHPPAIGELSHRFPPHKRGFAVSLHGMGANLGEVLGPVVFASLLSFMIWRDALKTSVLPLFIVAFAVWVLLSLNRRESVDGSPKISGKDYFKSMYDLMKNRIVLILIITTALRSVGDGAVEGFLTTYMIEDLNYSFAFVAILVSSAQIAGIISQPVMGYASDRVGRKPVLVVGSALLMTAAFVLSVARPGIQVFIAILLRGALTYSLHHIFVAAALDAANGIAQSTIVSLVYGSGFAGTLSPTVAGLISDRYGIHSAFLCGGIVLIVPTVVLALTNFSGPSEAFKDKAQKDRS